MFASNFFLASRMFIVLYESQKLCVFKSMVRDVKPTIMMTRNFFFLFGVAFGTESVKLLSLHLKPTFSSFSFHSEKSAKLYAAFSLKSIFPRPMTQGVWGRESGEK